MGEGRRVPSKAVTGAVFFVVAGSVIVTAVLWRADRSTANGRSWYVLLSWTSLPCMGSVTLCLDHQGIVYEALPTPEPQMRRQVGRLDVAQVREVLSGIPRVDGVFVNSHVVDGYGLALRINHVDGFQTRVYLREIITPGLVSFVQMVYGAVDQSMRERLAPLAKDVRNASSGGGGLLLVERLLLQGTDQYDVKLSE